MIPGFIKLVLDKLRPKQSVPEHLRVGNEKLPKGATIRVVQPPPPIEYAAQGFEVAEPMANRMRK